MSEPLKRLAAAALVMAIVAALSFALLRPALPALPVDLLLLLGVFACAVYGGPWAGLLATAIGVAAAFVLREQVGAPGAGNAASVLFAGAGVAASLIVHVTGGARASTRAGDTGARHPVGRRSAGNNRPASTEERLRTVVDTLPDIVFTAGVDGRLQVLNGHWLDIGPESAGDAGGLLDLVHPDDAARVRRMWSEATDAQTPLDVRCRLRGRDGSYRWVLARAQVSAAATKNGEHWFGVIIDIDKTVVAERALRDSDERLQLALAATGLGSFEMEFGSGAHRFNETARAMLGFAPDALLTADLIDERIEPRDLQRVREAIARARAIASRTRCRSRGSMRSSIRSAVNRASGAKPSIARAVSLKRCAPDPNSISKLPSPVAANASCSRSSLSRSARSATTVLSMSMMTPNQCSPFFVAAALTWARASTQRYDPSRPRRRQRTSSGVCASVASLHIRRTRAASSG